MNQSVLVNCFMNEISICFSVVAVIVLNVIVLLFVRICVSSRDHALTF